jgi:hypothetical protein
VDAVFHYARSDSNLGDLVGRYAELGMMEFLLLPRGERSAASLEDVANSPARSANRLGQEDGMSHTPALTDRQSSGRCTACVAPRLTWTEALQGEEDVESHGLHQHSDFSKRRRTGIEPAWELSPPHRF